MVAGGFQLCVAASCPQLVAASTSTWPSIWRVPSAVMLSKDICDYTESFPETWSNLPRIKLRGHICQFPFARK